jgi:hypothetical protein
MEIRKHKKIKNILGINMVVMPINYMEIGDIIKFAGKYNFQEVNLLPPIIKNKKQSQYKLTKDIVDILKNKRKYFYDLANKYNIVLFNGLPDNIEDDCSLNKSSSWYYKENFCSINDNNTEDKVFYKDNINVHKKVEKQDQYSLKLFCYQPFKRITIDNRQTLPSCLCPVVKHNYGKLKICDNSIIVEWNNIDFQKYRKYMIYNKQNNICSQDCLQNKFINNDI